jgi:hypothetical protein
LHHQNNLAAATPIRDGFRATWRCPGLVPAEIAWRWVAGGAFWALLILSFHEYAASLEVSKGNWFVWKLGYPPAAIQAFANSIAGSGHKLLTIAAILIPGMAVIWTVAASIGRAATLRAIMPERPVCFRTMLGINFFRSALMLAALIGYAGVFAIAMTIYSDGPGTVPHPERSTWVLLVGWAVVAYLWSVANWFLSLAPVMAVEENCDAVAAAIASVRVFGERIGPFIRVNVIFGALHLLVFVAFTAISFLPLLFAAAVSFRILLLVMGLVTIGYFAVIDFLYIARLGAYATVVANTGA